MSELHTRVREYLDKKRAVKSEIVLDDADCEASFLSQFKEEYKYPLLFIKTTLGIFAIITVMWAVAVVDIQNDCWVNKECREWVKNR